MLPLHALISSCQYLLFLISYNALILLSSSDHARLTSSQRVRRKRLSSALTRRRAARHSASNHGVDCVCIELLQVDSGGLTVLSTTLGCTCWPSRQHEYLTKADIFNTWNTLIYADMQRNSILVNVTVTERLCITLNWINCAVQLCSWPRTFCNTVRQQIWGEVVILI